ncbi:unnamed protein product [Urochloa humidicola]
MSEVVAQMRRAIGDEGTNVTLARNLLAPVAPRLSASFGAAAVNLHRRCHMAAAVVVFATPAGVESALCGPARGSCHRVVLPLELGAEMPAVIRPTDVKMMSDSGILVATGCGTPVTGGACTPPQPQPEGAAWMEFREPSASPRGTKRFRLSSESLWMHDDMIAVDQRGMRMEHGDSR